ncbi:MAG: 2OG-Fe(II) oxygenase [Thalassobaculaceae bacterium]|nr:2OG-Fe(II) oxygenase [Thalassobaculaceae bacterium]
MTSNVFPKFRAGDFLPTFIADSPINPRFEFDSVAGRNVVLCFVASGTKGRSALGAKALRMIESGMHRRGILIYFVTADPDDRQGTALTSDDRRTMPFWDTDLSIHRAYGMLDHNAPRDGVFVIGKNLRLIEFLDFSPAGTFIRRMIETVKQIPANAPLAPAGGHAPVLQVSNVFEPDLCRQLIDEYEADGGGRSGVMRDVNGITTGFFDDTVKRRRDAQISNPETLARIRRNLHRRLVGEIKKVYAFDASRIERFIVGCYDSGDSGFFKAHRDNGGPGTAHRRFAVTINLNAEEYEGGELWFPEYGPHLYKPATGSAVVFSCSMLHEARAVTRGRRYAFLPFLFDAAAARIRDTNRGRVDLNVRDLAGSPAA